MPSHYAALLFSSIVSPFRRIKEAFGDCQEVTLIDSARRRRCGSRSVSEGSNRSRYQGSSTSGAYSRGHRWLRGYLRELGNVAFFFYCDPGYRASQGDGTKPQRKRSLFEHGHHDPSVALIPITMHSCCAAAQFNGMLRGTGRNSEDVCSMESRA